MFGFNEYFDYLECGYCGCLQLLKIPTNMEKYYPPTYFSFQPHGKWKTFFRRQWAAYAYAAKNPLGWIITALYGPKQAILAVRRAGVSPEEFILDVGCGSGRLLLDLGHIGYRHLTGIDPFIAHDIDYGNGVTILKKHISETRGSFSLVMLHYSFEHMDNPLETMKDIARLIRPGGKAILRIPIVSSWAWAQYGVHWVNLDAPRHLFLHSYKSIEYLAEQAGLIIEEIVHEGRGEQIWLSEQYSQGIPLSDPQSLSSAVWKQFLFWKKIREAGEKAQELNRQGRSDLVCLYLRKLEYIMDSEK